MSTITPVAYQYDTELYCPDCILATLGEHQGSTDTESALNVAAHNKGIDRHREEMYDSGDFPKAVFDVARCLWCATMDVHRECEPECCCGCGEELWHFA